MCKFRTLQANEIEVRVAQIYSNKSGVSCSLLLYQDARAAMKLLDEAYPGRWTRSQQILGDRLYCTISIYDAELHEWISRQDVGTESNTEPEKGQASDAFKRAAVNWGIGRELYTAPNIRVELQDGDYENSGGKIRVKTYFKVASITYNADREITQLSIIDKKGEIVYSFGIGRAGRATRNQSEKPVQQTSPEFKGFDDAPANNLTEVTKRKPKMFASVIKYAAAGETFQQVNARLAAIGHCIAMKTWNEIQDSF